MGMTAVLCAAVAFAFPGAACGKFASFDSGEALELAPDNAPGLGIGAPAGAVGAEQSQAIGAVDARQLAEADVQAQQGTHAFAMGKRAFAKAQAVHVDPHQVEVRLADDEDVVGLAVAMEDFGVFELAEGSCEGLDEITFVRAPAGGRKQGMHSPQMLIEILGAGDRLGDEKTVEHEGAKAFFEHGQGRSRRDAPMQQNVSHAPAAPTSRGADPLADASAPVARAGAFDDDGEWSGRMFQRSAADAAGMRFLAGGGVAVLEPVERLLELFAPPGLVEGESGGVGLLGKVFPAAGIHERPTAESQFAEVSAAGMQAAIALCVKGAGVGEGALVQGGDEALER